MLSAIELRLRRGGLDGFGGEDEKMKIWICCLGDGSIQKGRLERWCATSLGMELTE